MKKDMIKKLSDYVNAQGKIAESGCCDGWNSDAKDVNGFCSSCDYPTVDGVAASGCRLSPISCKKCGHRYCDQSC